MPLGEELPEGFGMEIAKDQPKKTSKAKKAQLKKPNKMLETKSLSGSLSFTGSTIEVGMAFQFNNMYGISESESIFSTEVIICMSWVDPKLAEAITDGTIKEGLSNDKSGEDLWEDWADGWEFSDFDGCPSLTDQENYRSAFIINEVIENRPVPIFMNRIESMQMDEEPIILMDAQLGRVGYILNCNGKFQEEMELSAFPFDSQVFDVQIYFLPSAYEWRLGKHPDEKLEWWGQTKLSTDGKRMLDNPEWSFNSTLHDHIDDFLDTNGKAYPRYTMRASGKRLAGYFVINVFGVVFLLAGLGLGIFLFEPTEFEQQFENILTLFLTIVAFRIVLSDKLPKVSYLTVADVYILSVFFMYTFTAIACFVIRMKLKANVITETRAETILEMSMFAYIGIWLFSHIFTLLRALYTQRAEERSRLEHTGWVMDGQTKRIKGALRKM